MRQRYILNGIFCFDSCNFNSIRSSIKYPFEIETATGTHTRRIIIRDLSPRFISSVTISILISSYHKLDRSLTSPAKVKRYYLIVREGGEEGYNHHINSYKDFSIGLEPRPDLQPDLAVIIRRQQGANKET